MRTRARTWILRAGFGVVIACLAFSTVYAYRLQSSLAEQAHDIYQRHLRQDNILYQLRRSIWLGSAASRDYLINPSGESALRLADETGRLRAQCLSLVDELARNTAPAIGEPSLAHTVRDFWNVLAGLPQATARMTQQERYEYVQVEVVPRRNAAGELFKEFAVISENWLKESEREFSSTRRGLGGRLLLILGLSLALSILTAVMSLRHAEHLERKTAEQYAEVERARKELQELSARLLDVQEKERARLSRELHDDIGQMIATLRLEIARSESLEAGRVQEIRERLRRARELSERTLQSIRDICRMLRPNLLDDLGLEPALDWQVEDFTRRTGIECRVDARGITEDLPDAIRTCVYRVLQESLHNCEKHAGARSVAVAITQTADTLSMKVTDDGCGFDPSGLTANRAHFGILGMRERAASVGGTFEIRSSPGAGTTIQLAVPLGSRGAARSAVGGA